MTNSPSFSESGIGSVSDTSFEMMSDLDQNVAETPDSVAKPLLDRIHNHSTMFFCDGMITIRVCTARPLSFPWY